MSRWGSPPLRALVGFGALSLICSVSGGGGEPDVGVLVANVGNLDMLTDGPCAEWPARGALCVGADEDRVADAIVRGRPDVVALMEVIGAARCAAVPSDLEVCLRGGESSVRRIVGAGYTVVCDAIGGYDCLAFRASMFEVVGCPGGGTCLAETAPHPAACADQADFSSVSWVTTRGRGGEVRWVLAHPYQAVNDEEDRCRAAQLRQAFAAVSGDGPAVVLGDLNVDPERLGWAFGSAQAWFEGLTRAGLRDLHGGLLLPPGTWLGGLSFDRVAVRAWGGGCATLPPLAGGGRGDHRAVQCALDAP